MQSVSDSYSIDNEQMCGRVELASILLRSELLC